MLFNEWNLEDALVVEREEGREKGREEGIELGLETVGQNRPCRRSVIGFYLQNNRP